MMRPSIVIIFCNVLSVAKMENGSSFSRPNVGVYFNPFVSIEDKGVPNAYDINGLIPMISKISSEFTKIMTGIVGLNTEPSHIRIPSAVATFNKLHRNPEQEKLEVLLTFGMSVIQEPATLTKLEIAKVRADNANEIFPGTVKTLYLENVKISDENIEEVKKYLEFAQNFLQNTSYNLGAVLHIEDCGRRKGLFANYLPRILPFLHQIYFELVLDVDGKLSADEVLPETTRTFQQCLKRFEVNNLEILVGFRTAWTENIQAESLQRDKNLVQYWEKLNDWAVEFNSSIVLENAFDIPFQENSYGFTGWWRLIENATYYDEDSSKYVFEEKRAAIKRLEMNRKKEPGSTTTSSTSIWLIAVGVLVLLIFLFATGLVVYFRWKNTNSLLQNNELKKFYKGISNTAENGEEGFNPDIQKTAFNKDLELSKSDFKIEMEALLGTGAFGAVYRGRVKSVGGEAETQVAVKTTSPSSPSLALTGLLSEIKVMNYMGKHDNIVNIVGAYTKGMKKGKVYLFLELCSLGSLEKYLRKNVSGLEFQNQERRMSVANYYKSFDQRGKTVEAVQIPDSNENEGITSSKTGMTSIEDADLYRWSCEIANGMAFLASKNVVHADLATRNVLLTIDKRAKISDFGLSRRLYDYSMYVKSQQEPLPWRWMAPESLRRMEFNEKTDVWAFGVTLWEIYSLGDVPFEGLSWTPNFSSQLSQGLRLPEPRHSITGMYSLMLRCWNEDPAGRPPFADLIYILQQKF